MRVEGVGENTAILLTTLSEVMSRATLEEPLKMKSFKNKEDLFELAASLFVNNSREALYLLCFDSAKRLKKRVEMANGNETKVEIDPSEIAKCAVLCDADSCVLVHNHPTASATPSVADMDATRSVAVFLRRLGHPLSDHLIVGSDGTVVSMKSDHVCTSLFY